MLLHFEDFPEDFLGIAVKQLYTYPKQKGTCNWADTIIYVFKDCNTK